ncbi:hypothetical protein ACHHYP_02722 [Achlya hypogyna]|uniref:E2F/DP family winged-helix DNA-binding domain-containing protein n=1 Tax=Achlya hypogyna TaxID=1202772 RepID=A0A1V9Z5M5_ACHHY|nr:hypothetical protein ACHHYP_02722 [Achlya hypogyna]
MGKRKTTMDMCVRGNGGALGNGDDDLAAWDDSDRENHAESCPIPDDVKAHFAARVAGMPEASYTMVQVCEYVLELLQMLSTRRGMLLPLVLRAGVIAAGLKLPRRRIYDVLHVLDAIGLVSRAPRGYWYFGEGNIAPTLRALKEGAVAAVAGIRPTVGLERTARVLDETDIDNKPALVHTTTKVLRLLFAANRPVLHSDLQYIDDASREPKRRRTPTPKISKPLEANAATKTAAIATKGRRSYDVLAVLAQCNIVRVFSGPNHARHVSINSALFDANFSLFTAPPPPPCRKMPAKTKTASKPLSPDASAWCDVALPAFLVAPLSVEASAATDAAMALLDWDQPSEDLWSAVEAVDPLFPVLRSDHDDSFEGSLDHHTMLLDVHDWLDA